jgi:predicted alpha/beta hydrolase family esterase
MELDALASMLHKRINEVSKTKPIIMIYHSFGTYIFAQYCQMFKNDRIIGLIDVGGAPIRFYPVARTLMIDMKDVSIGFIRENIDIVF